MFANSVRIIHSPSSLFDTYGLGSCDASAHLYPRDSLQHQCCGHLPSRTHIFAPSFERRDLDIWYTILAREADAKAEPEASAEACVDFYLEEREADAEAEASPELEEREADAEADDYLEFEEREADAEAEDDFSLGLEGREAEAEANLELEDWLYGTDSYDDFF